MITRKLTSTPEQALEKRARVFEEIIWLVLKVRVKLKPDPKALKTAFTKERGYS